MRVWFPLTGCVSGIHACQPVADCLWMLPERELCRCGAGSFQTPRAVSQAREAGSFPEIGPNLLDSCQEAYPTHLNTEPGPKHRSEVGLRACSLVRTPQLLKASCLFLPRGPGVTFFSPPLTIKPCSHGRLWEPSDSGGWPEILSKSYKQFSLNRYSGLKSQDKT